VHGGTPGVGAEAFAAQRPLAQRRHLVLPDRPGHGQTPAEGREDFERDAALLAPLLGPGGAHVVGHSYGGVVALYIAAGHPERVRSLTLIEPPAFWLAPEDPATVAMSAANRTLIEDPPSDPWETLERFFALVGMEPLPAVLASMKPLPPPYPGRAHPALPARAVGG
jgi:pimeloyl-ACP methyl ester carboxylesterase